MEREASPACGLLEALRLGRLPYFATHATLFFE